MKTLFSCACVAISMSFAAINPADAKGCIKGAVVGGGVGHMAGHHGVIGAATGCAIRHHEANKHQNDTDNR